MILLKNNIFHFIIGSFVGITLSFIITNKKYIIDNLKTLSKLLLKKYKNDNIPSDCPGIYSINAGKSKTCEGCPNRKICNDDELKNEMQKNKLNNINNIKNNLKDIKSIILILSGKGGVGKSTIASQIAFTLSYLNYQVGLLDIDICGPSIPVLTNTIDSDVNYSMNGWVPIYKNNLSIMSIGYLLPNFDNAVIWRSPKKNGLIKQFLCDVYWNKLDFLIIDCPPGTSDEHLTICNYLENNVDGCIIVSTPHILSICDVKKEIEFAKKINLPVLGVVENMYQSIFSCDKYNVEKMCKDMNVEYAGKVTFHKDLINACENGVGCCDINNKSNSCKEIFSICKFVINSIINKPSNENEENNKETNSDTFDKEKKTEKLKMLNKLLEDINKYI